jgi:hypothetical protein
VEDLVSSSCRRRSSVERVAGAGHQTIVIEAGQFPEADGHIPIKGPRHIWNVDHRHSLGDRSRQCRHARSEIYRALDPRSLSSRFVKSFHPVLVAAHYGPFERCSTRQISRFMVPSASLEKKRQDVPPQVARTAERACQADHVAFMNITVAANIGAGVGGTRTTSTCPPPAAKCSGEALSPASRAFGSAPCRKSRPTTS